MIHCPPPREVSSLTTGVSLKLYLLGGVGSKILLFCPASMGRLLLCSRHGNEASSNSFRGSQQTSLPPCCHSGWTQKPPIAWRLSIRLPDPAYPSPLDLKTLDPFKASPKSRRLGFLCTAGHGFRQGHVSCQGGKAGKSSLHAPVQERQVQ